MSNDLEQIRTRITPKLREYGVTRAAVFGSRARGEAGPDSDLDLVVEFERGRSLLDLVGLKQDLTEMLGTRADIVTYNALHPLLREQILTEQVRLL